MRVTCSSPSPPGCLTRLEKITDRELEDDGLLTRDGPEGDAPLEPKGADGRLPPEAESPAGAVGADIERVETGVLGCIHVERNELAVLVLEIEGVADVGEDHAANSHLVEDGELDLRVADHLHVAADEEVAERAVRRLGALGADHRTQRTRREPADVIDAAHEVALEDRDAAIVPAGNEAEVPLEPKHERTPERIKGACDRFVAREDVLRCDEIRVGD